MEVGGLLKVVLCDEDNIYIQLLKKLIMEIAIRNNYNIEIAVMVV